MELPLHESAYRVWKIERRRARSCSHDWQVALRIGDPPSGVFTKNLTKKNQTPPGIRKTNFREVIAFSQAPNQIGVPATQNTDSNLGYAFYENQSASIALPPGEKRRRILMRVEGTTSHGGSGERLQKAKVGYCVCCSYITHVAVPPTHTAGSYEGEKCMSTTL